jgi:hypothetical protein
MVRRFVLCTAALLTLSATAFGQKTIKVYVTGETDENSKEVAHLVRGKIGSTLRYSLSDSLEDADLGMQILCVPVGAALIACSAPTLYFSTKNHNLTYPLLGIILFGDRPYTAEHLFDNFVEDTSPDKLQKMDEFLAGKVREIYMRGYADGVLVEHHLKDGPTPNKN